MTNPSDDANGAPQHRRISVTAARRMLGMIGRNYSDAEIETLLGIQFEIAEAAYELFVDAQSSDPDYSGEADISHIED